MAIRRGNNLYWKTGLDNTGLKKGAAQAKGILKTMSQQITGLDLFAGLGIAATVAFAKVTKSAWDMAKGLDLAMREVQSISGAAQENFEGMVESVRRLAKEGPEGAESLSKALYQIVSAGYDGAEGLELLEVATQAAVAGVTDTITAADGLTSAMNAWKIESSEAQSVADSFFTTVKLGKTTFGELANSISLVAPMASTLGVGLDEVNSAVASLTKQGTPTAVAMTQIRQIMISLNEHLGQGWRETMTFQEGMEELARMAKDSGKDIKEYTGRIEGAIGIMGLTGPNAEAARKDLEKFNSKLGASAEAYEIMSRAAENQIKVMKNRWHDKLLAYGDNIIQMFGRMASALNSQAVIKALEDEAKAAKLAVLDITSLAEGTEARQEAIEALQLLYPAYFGNLDAETAKNDEITASLERMNDEYTNKIVLQEYAKELEAVDKKEQKLKETRLEAIELLNTYGEAMGKSGLQYKDLVAEIQKAIEEGGYENDGYSYLLPGGGKRDLEKALEFLEEYEGKLQDIADEKFGIIELKDRILELLQISQGIDDTNPDFVGPQEFDYNSLSKPKEAGFSEDAFKEFRAQLQEAKQAYEDWKIYKSTSYSEEIANDKAHIFALGQTYQEYLTARLENEKLNSQERLVLIRELAKIEYEQTKRTAEGVRNLAKLKADAVKAEKDSIKELYAEWDIYISDLEKAITDQLNREEEQRLNKAKSMEQEVENIRLRYASRKEVLRKQIAQLTEYYTAGIIKLKEYEELKKKVIDESTSLAIDKLQGEIAQVGDAMTGLFRQLDLDVSEVLDGISSSIDGILGAVKSWYSGDVAGVITGTVKGLTGLIETVQEYANLSREMEIEAQEKAMEKMNFDLAATNRLIQEQILLLNDQTGNEWLDTANSSLGLLREQMDATIDVMRNLQLVMSDDRGTHWYPDLSNWDISDFQNYYDEHGFESKFGDDLYTLIQEYQSYADQIISITNDINSTITGTTYDSIVDGIAAGFRDGKRSVEDFAETFEDLMKEAIFATFKRQFLQSQIQEWYDLFAKYLKNQGGGSGIKEHDWGEEGEITPWEEGLLTELWERIIENAEEGYAQLEDMFGELFDASEDVDKQGLRGAIQGITEDTAGLIAGQFTAMRYNILEQTEVAEDQLDALNEIALNTSNTNLALAIANDTLARINRAVGGAA